MNRPPGKLVAGIMSGTSLDGIDAVLLRLTGNGRSTGFRQVAHLHRPFPRGLKEALLKNSVPGTSRVDDIARLNVFLAELYAAAVRSLAKKAGVRLSRIDLIGTHGQTIHHLPQPVRMFGRNVRATLQIGDPSVLATLTGITTVGGFRTADMAVGGQGAPLVPYFDWLFLRSATRNRIVLNLGGIANMTVLPKRCSPAGVIAFDTGPANMVVDALMQTLYKKPFDRNGTTASRGLVILEVLDWMKRHPFLRKAPPKSTGREEFGVAFVRRLLRRARLYDREDIVATAADFSAYAVFNAYTRFVRKDMRVDEVIVSGGGIRNRFMMAALKEYFRPAAVLFSDDLGIASGTKEAACFAVLANECIAGNPANIPSVTGASRGAVLGSVARPRVSTGRRARS